MTDVGSSCDVGAEHVVGTVRSSLTLVRSVRRTGPLVTVEPFMKPHTSGHAAVEEINTWDVPIPIQVQSEPGPNLVLQNL